MNRSAAVARMLGARSIAVVGASARAGSFGDRMVIEALRGTARVHLVNPRYDRIGAQACHASLADLPEPVDLVMLGVPDAAVVEQLEAAVAAGISSAVLFGSANGVRDKVAAIATEAGMAVCGAGCMGFLNNVAGVRALGYLEPDPVAEGGISLVSHSGSAFSTLLRARRRFGFRLAVSSGQELVTDTADYVEYALDDPGTRIVALMMETPRRVPQLRRALLRAADAGVPVCVLPVGGSPRGRAMVAAHSGALAGEAAGWEAFCETTGAVRVHDLAELVDTLELFSAPRRPRAPGGIATVHDSGAERALTVDIAHDLGIGFAELADATLAELGDLLDEGLVATNPLDMWGTGADTRTLFGDCLRLMSKDPAVAVTALAVDLVSEYDGDTSYGDAVLDVADETDAALAVLASVPSAIDSATADKLRDNGIPVLEGTRSGLAAMAHLASWPPQTDRCDAVVQHERRQRWSSQLAGAIGRFAMLADYGVPVVAVRSAESVADVLAAADAVGYPVALKTLAAEHKTEVGGVVLDIQGETALRAAYTEMARRLGPRVSVSAMAPAGIEVSIGFVRDPAFGPLLIVAAGGTLVELLADRVVACPPVSHVGARKMLEGLRIRPLLHGWRGAPAIDVDALADVIVAFSEMAVELGDAVDAVEANPVIASPGGVVAVDALVIPRRIAQ